MPGDLSRRVLQRYLRAKADRLGTDFPSPEALKDYLHEHPHADKSKHTVVSPKEREKEHEKTPKKKGLFDAEKTKHLSGTIKQETKDPDTLFKDAEKAQEHQLKWLNQGQGLDKTIGAHVIRKDKGDDIDFTHKGPIIVIGNLKSKERAKEKVDSDFGGDWSRVGDVVRASVALDSYSQLEDVIKKLESTGLKLARKPKDRFENPTDAGYRDVLLNVVHPNGHVGELQLHLKPILHAKDAGHKFYEDVRSIEAKAKKEGRTTMTDEETKKVNDANQKMKDLYDDAWKKATKEVDKTKNAALHVASERTASSKFYEFGDLPAQWEQGKFPVVIAHDHPRAVYDLERFFRQATPISEHEFKALKEDLKKKASLAERILRRYQP